MEDTPVTENALVINDSVRIPYAEILYRTARSSGPGGQHTNKTETAVELVFDLANSVCLTHTERALAMQRLASTLDSSGVMHVESQSERSQLRNREEVTERFVILLRAALVPVKHRRKTKPSRAAHERRITHKRNMGEVKKLRRRPSSDD